MLDRLVSKLLIILITRNAHAIRTNKNKKAEFITDGNEGNRV